MLDSLIVIGLLVLTWLGHSKLELFCRSLAAIPVKTDGYYY